MAKYGSRSTAYNGVANFLVKFDIPRERKFVLGFNDVNEVMKKFINDLNESPKKDINKNAEFVQDNFKKFVFFVKTKYSKF